MGSFAENMRTFTEHVTEVSRHRIAEAKRIAGQTQHMLQRIGEARQAMSHSVRESLHADRARRDDAIGAMLAEFRQHKADVHGQMQRDFAEARRGRRCAVQATSDSAQELIAGFRASRNCLAADLGAARRIWQARPRCSASTL